MAAIDCARWLTFIQGKDVPARVLADIRGEVGEPIPAGKKLLDRIKEVIYAKGYQVDANYVYANMMGMHVAPMDLATENAALSAIQGVVDRLGDKAPSVPLLYILKVVCERDGLGVVVPGTFPKEKAEVYDRILQGAL